MKDNVDLDGERDFLDFCYHVETKRFTQIMPYGSPYAITMDGDSHQRFTGVEFAPDGNFDIAFTITRKQALDVLKGLKKRVGH